MIHPWLGWIGSLSDWICVGKVFKYIRNIQNLILDKSWISKWKVLFDSLNHVRLDNYFLRNPKLDHLFYFPVQIFKSTIIPSYTA